MEPGRGGSRSRPFGIVPGHRQLDLLMEARGSQESGMGGQGSFVVQLPAVEWKIPWKGVPGRLALGSRHWALIQSRKLRWVLPWPFTKRLGGAGSAGSAERRGRPGRAVLERRGYVAPKAASTKGACGQPPASLGLPLASRHRQSFGRGSRRTPGWRLPPPSHSAKLRQARTARGGGALS